MRGGRWRQLRISCRRYFSFSGRESVEEKICKNLRYNLEQMKIAGEKEMFMKIVDSIIVGPEIIRQDDV